MNERAVVFEEITDPNEIARSRTIDEQAKKNGDWLQTHWSELLPHARGKFVAVAGQEAFIGETMEEAWNAARRAHPNDPGALLQHVRSERGVRVHAFQG